MHNDFKPVHLKKANAKLEKLVSEANSHMQENDTYKTKVSNRSLWKKFLRLFKR